MIALRRFEGFSYPAIAIAIAVSCAKAENSPLADRGGDGEAGDNGTGKGGSAAQGGSGGGTGGSAGSAAKGGSTSTTGGSAGKGGTTSTTGGSAGKGGGATTGGTAGTTTTTYGCLDDGEGGEGGASGGAPGEAGAGGAGPATLFLDDFEDGDANGWTPLSGSFGIVDDGSKTYEQSDWDSTTPYFSVVSDTCWADQIVEGMVRVLDFHGNSTSNAAGLFARYVSPETHYMIGIDSGNGGELYIGRRIQSASSSPERIVKDDGVPQWDPSRWYKLRLEVVGTNLKAYLDDVLMLETTDTQITSGGVAVGTRHAHARFDDVKVTTP